MNRYLAAAYYRMATIQGRVEFGLNWIFKDKYNKFFKEKFPKQYAIENASKAKKRDTSQGRKRSDSNASSSLGIAGRKELHSSMGVLIHVQAAIQTVVEAEDEKSEAEKNPPPIPADAQ